MFMDSKGTFRDFDIWDTVFENPHCGKSLVPFTNRTTLCEVTTLSNVDFNTGVNAGKLGVHRHRNRR